jgi:hypothetical protein
MLLWVKADYAPIRLDDTNRKRIFHSFAVTYGPGSDMVVAGQHLLSGCPAGIPVGAGAKNVR